MNPPAYTLATLCDGDTFAPAIAVGERYFPFAGFHDAHGMRFAPEARVGTGASEQTGGAHGRPRLPETLLAAFADWRRWAPLLDEAAAHAARSADGVPAAGVTLATPLLYPRKCFCVGANYQSHLDEMNASAIRKVPGKPPFFFLKPPSTTFVGPGPTVHLPTGCEFFDWEIELAVVFGRGGRHIAEADAMAHVAGYTLACDFTSRNQMFAPDTFFKFDFTLGKCQDTANPVGPAILPAHFVPDWREVEFALAVNGVEKQRARAGEMIYSLPEQIAGVSRFISIEPGDVMLTGSPAGVGWPRGEKLAAGDVVTLSSAAIGEMALVIQPPVT
jgi:2-keto-4-pentenoate hydratase/2-oxohepta-3-ene-1,7-dioic acid hydratase in catechol pathway